ncbi:MAG: alpha-glucosidase [Acidobacteria bacterium]|nr:MAG: alpha-glucosidase [Acidobacteriota bacterium]PYT41542.1 MAG: alpha-glucosidase [Acidobacteriota bacterium]PYT42785.1 MAG: alpha-glucosidase [Acidobacteriota bacterium]
MDMTRFARRLGIGLFASVFGGGLAVAQGWQHLGKVQRVEKLKDGVELTAGTAKVRLTVFRDGVFRVRVAPNGTFPKDFSWAVIESPEPPAVKFEENQTELKIAAGNVVATIQRSPLLINFCDPAGNVLLADEPNLPMAWNGRRVHAWKKMPADENYFGLGDKAGPMNRRNRAFTDWNTDEFGWQESSDPLYKTIPFFIGLRNGLAYGLFFDNTYRSVFDFGKESQDYFSFGAEGGELNYYFIAGPDPKKIIEEYTALTGRSPLPPLWTLGYQQCRYSYYPESRAREIVKTLREKKIPADAIYFDIDYQQGNAPFTINREYFPTFEKMIADFRAQGMHTILITDLHIKKDPNHAYAPYDSGMKNDVFVKNPDGSVFVGTVWPGESVFPDFTLTRVRDWWGGLYKDFVGMGAAGFWNDMNEPALFLRADKTMPLDVVHRLDDGTTLDHRAIHNIYGMQNVRATYDGLRKLQANERPFVLTRAAYSGAQRYSATWTGDNSSTWNHLKMSTPMLLSMGISGFPLIGDDIGGFAGSPTADLLTRWFEVGALNPIYRDHTAKGTADQEPWVHGPEHEAIRRRYMELRYMLMPYLYTGIEEASRTGLPLMRPVFLEYPHASDFYGDNRDFLFGRDFFAAPVTTEMVDAEEISFPPGEWYDFWTNTKLSSKEKLSLHPRLDEMPLYVRAGAIVPMQPLVQSTEEKPKGPLQLRVYLPSSASDSDCRGTLYQDDGHTFAYQKGEILRVNYSCQVSNGSVTVTSNTEKIAYHPWWNSAELRLVGTTVAPKEVRIGDQVTREWRYDGLAHSVTLTVPDAARNWTVRLAF